jgi:NAD(P)-dependent dehydrogenase (short-subunit alcohol dehydrogenase family)
MGLSPFINPGRGATTDSGRAVGGHDRLRGKVAIVTGAGSSGPGIGVGRAISVLFALQGARVALIDLDLDEARVTQDLITKGEDSSPDADTMLLQSDVSDRGQCDESVREVVSRWGRLDILVNNVGIAGPTGTAVTTDMAEWERGMQVNVTSMVLMARFAIPEMIKVGAGSIINLASIAGLRGAGKSLMYATSKGAVVNLTRMMAFQHGPDGIRVNAIVPGGLATPMSDADGMTELRRERRRLRSLLRTEGTAWDVAHAAVYLGSEEARWVTGILLPVDGGFLAADDET